MELSPDASLAVMHGPKGLLFVNVSSGQAVCTMVPGGHRRRGGRLAPTAVAGQTLAAQVVQIDPVAVSPDRFKVLLENQHVRVVEYALLPGERDQWHTHPPKVSYVVTGGTLRITTDDGQSFLSDEKTGSASWMATLGRHFAQNVGETPVRIVLTEIKSAS